MNDAYDVRLKEWRLTRLEGRPGFTLHRSDICDRDALKRAWDAGGPYDGVIGFKKDQVLQRFALQRSVSLEVAKKDVRLAAAVVEADPATGRALAVSRFLLPAP